MSGTPTITRSVAVAGIAVAAAATVWALSPAKKPKQEQGSKLRQKLPLETSSADDARNSNASDGATTEGRATDGSRREESVSSSAADASASSDQEEVLSSLPPESKDQSRDGAVTREISFSSAGSVHRGPTLPEPDETANEMVAAAAAGDASAPQAAPPSPRRLEPDLPRPPADTGSPEPVSTSALILVYAAVLVAALAGILGVALQRYPRAQIPAHMIHHSVVFEHDLLSQGTAVQLLDYVRQIGNYPTNVADTSFYHTEHEHIGEATPVERVSGTGGTGPTGSKAAHCAHPFLIPSRDRTLCVLPGRVDIGRHFVQTGGVKGLRETYRSLVSRVQSFGAYFFDLTQHPRIVQSLFTDERFLNFARGVCPPTKQHLDPFQFNFIIQVPGQTVATHVDGVYFWGASRFQFPQWLLAAMKFSGMWEDRFVDQVQVVGYLHEWEPASNSTLDTDQDGSFVYWNSADSAPSLVSPHPRAGSVVDGSKIVHAATTYRADAELPALNPNNPHWLRHRGDDSWTLTEETADGVRLLANYTTSDLRISIVYRGRCFENATKARAFRDQLEGPDGVGGRLALEDILSTFITDLINRGLLSQGTTLQEIPRLDLATMIMDTYIKYPLPTRKLLPWNYCALGRLMPWLDPVISLICK